MLSNCNLDFRERRTIVYLYVNSIPPSTSRNLQKANRPSPLKFCIEKSFSKATMIFQSCSTVTCWILTSKRENKSCKARDKSGCVVNVFSKFDLLDVDFMWLAGASLDQYNNNTNVGSVWVDPESRNSQLQPQPATYQEPENRVVAEVLSYPAHISEWWADFGW